MTFHCCSRAVASTIAFVAMGIITTIFDVHAQESFPEAALTANTVARPIKTLGTVIVTGSNPTSLPTEIPTTIEGVTGEQVAQTTNATDAEDALKYFPSLLVRKRYIGDYDHAVLATRASGTGNSARSLIYADGILLSNLLGNGATFTPRWGLITPEEIERVDVLYGPFSAAYSGNSVGAVVDYVTRMPTRLEAHVKVSAFTSHFDDYGIDDRFSGYQASASLGDKSGNLSWWLSYNHLDSNAQPITFANKRLLDSSAVTIGTPVFGALAGKNPRDQDWYLLGNGTQTHTLQDHGKIKLAYDFSTTLRASYTLGVWRNDSTRNSDSYLRDAAGNQVYSTPSGFIAIDGRQYSLTAADFAPSLGELQHAMHGLSIKSHTQGTWDWEAAASLYDYSKDLVRSPLGTLPAASVGGNGRIADMSGTGWNTFALKTVWRPNGGANQVIDMGYQRESYKLRTLVSNASNWIEGDATSRFSVFNGNTQLQSLYAQDSWRVNDDWRTTLGGRVEEWRATDGEIADAISINSFPTRKNTYFSPKAAVAYQVNSDWALKASLGRAVRMPTVSELYQGSLVAGEITFNDPNLQPEKSSTDELTAERALAAGRLRVTLFHEDSRDALYSQATVNPAGGTINTVQNIDHIRTIGAETVLELNDIGVHGLDLLTSATYARSRIIENSSPLNVATVGKWQPRVPEWRANFLATYRAGENWVYTLGARYSGQQYSQLDNSDPNGYSYTGVSKFFVIDVRTRYRIAKQWSASIGIDNVNNYKYWNFHPYPERTYVVEVNWDL